MFGLLIKDFFNIRKQIAWYIGMIAVFFVVSLSVRNLTFQRVDRAFGHYFRAAHRARVRGAENWQRFAAASGLGAKTMVAEKYLLGILFALSIRISIFAVFLFCFENGTTWMEFWFPVCMQFVILSVVLPLVFRYGVERGRTMTVLFVVVLVALFAAGMGLLGDRFSLAAPAVGIAAAVTLFLLVGSFFLSLKIYEKKEF